MVFFKCICLSVGMTSVHVSPVMDWQPARGVSLPPAQCLLGICSRSPLTRTGISGYEKWMDEYLQPSLSIQPLCRFVLDTSEQQEEVRFPKYISGGEEVVACNANFPGEGMKSYS